MKSADRPNLLDELLEALQSEQRLYGNLSLDTRVPATDRKLRINRREESGSRSTEAPASPEECRSLNELRALCEHTDELRTDLEGTRLVFGTGNPDADLMLIGEAPGFHEDKEGEPFVGKAGQLLNKILGAISFEREEVYIANILKHRPPSNRDPQPEERTRSLPYLIRQIELVDPRLILCLGRISATTLLDREDSLRNMRSRFHPFMGRDLMVTYHPAALLRNPQWKRPVWEDVRMLRRRYDELRSQK